MSSDSSRPSFRGALKDKLKKTFKSNITSSIPERLISNETYHHVRDKYHNVADTAKERTGLGKLINKTKGFLPGVFSSDKNETTPKGFYDSLFSPQTEQDVYVQVAIMCLWIIAMLCIIPTIITIFIPTKKNQTKTTGIRMIFFHILLCEFFYLIYILFSMINVALEFQLNTILCDFANYGMYVTIPVMHFALLFLSIERITNLCKSTMTWTRIFTKAYVTQLVLFVVWLLSTVIITTIMLIKKKFSLKSITNQVKDIAPPIFQGLTDKLSSPYRCSIDGRLSSIFKILFIILFIILILLIIKSATISVFYNFFTPTCCKTNREKTKSGNHHITLLYTLFLLLNLFFSYPFYFVSMAHSIMTHFTSAKGTFTLKLKLCFILRLSSIILQCFAFLTIESNSWSLLSSLLYRGTCKKIRALNNDIIYTRKPADTETKPEANVRSDSDDDDDDDGNGMTDESENKDNETENDDYDEVFILEPKSTQRDTKKSGTAIKVSTDQDDSDDDKKPVVQKPKRSTGKQETTATLKHKTDESDQENVPMIEATTTYRNTDGLSKHIPNGKLRAGRLASAPMNVKTSKSSTARNTTKHESIQLSSSDQSSNASVNSDDEIKPSTTKPIVQSVGRSSTNDQKRITTVLPNERRSHQPETKHSQVSRSSDNHHHARTTKQRRNSPRNTNYRSVKVKQYRSKKIVDHSDEV